MNLATPETLPALQGETVTGRLERDGIGYHYRLMRHPTPEFAPTLFVSGAFQTMDSWARFARAFAPRTTVLLVDPPGMGQSDVLPSRYGLDFLAECLCHLVDAVDAERVNVVAASYGTPAALRLAQRFPDRVERVVLAGTMKEIPAHLSLDVRETVATALAGDRALLAAQVIAGLLCRDESLPVDRRALAARVLRSGIERMSDLELQQYAANTVRLLEHEPLDLSGVLQGPEALIFTGEHDCFTLPEYCREVAGAFEVSHFTTILRADHLFHVEQFQVVIDLLTEFMRGRLATDMRGCAPLVRIQRGEAKS